MTRTYRLQRSQRIDRPLPEVFSFFADAANLQAITPPYLGFEILTPQPIAMRTGARIDYRISLLGVPMTWRTLISTWEPNVRFVDEQISGPYASWHHTHSFEADGDATVVSDVVEYRMPLGRLGRVARTLFVARTLDKIFDYRSEATERALHRDIRPTVIGEGVFSRIRRRRVERHRRHRRAFPAGDLRRSGRQHVNTLRPAPA